jgi:folate-dependent phosphoribosylglycinamide formyltransferase PurN
MNNGLRFVALTSSDIRAGTVINYILKNTDARIGKVYFDKGFSSRSAAQKTHDEVIATASGRRQAIRYHLGLARRMPRHYIFRVLERVTGIDELRFLHSMQRLHPSLLGIACGAKVPASLRVRPILRALSDVCQEYAIPLVVTESLNSPETIAALSADQPDVLIGLGTRILSRELLKQPRVGVLNAHSSLLPEYRGGTTEFWQLAHGEKETGVTVHWMAPRVDEGEIFAQASWEIPRHADHHQLRMLSLFNRLDLWSDVVRRLLGGEVRRERQEAARTPTFRHPTLRQQYEFYCLGRPPAALLPQSKALLSLRR